MLGDEPQWQTLWREEVQGAVLQPLVPEGPQPWERLPERPAGSGPPQFGVDPVLRVDLNASYGAVPDNAVYPRWPVCVRRLGAPEPVREGDLVPADGAPLRETKPVKATDRPTVFEQHKDDKGNNFAVRWPHEVMFTDGKRKRTLWFNCSTLGEEEARRQAWSYFVEAYSQATLGLTPFRAGVPNAFGPVSEAPDEFGLV